MMNNIFVSKKFTKMWRKSKMIAILKPGKDTSLPTSYRTISLLCHTYKLLERMILNCLYPITEHTIIAAYDTVNDSATNLTLWDD